MQLPCGLVAHSLERRQLIELQKKEIDREIELYKKREQDFETLIKAGDLIYQNQEDLKNKDFIFKLKSLLCKIPG